MPSSSGNNHVYELYPLSVVDSKRLFLHRIFGSEEECPSYLKDISNKILTKCDGLPLAIISIAGLLANKVHTVDQWIQVEHSIGRSLGRGSDKSVKAMVKILSLSYFDLPHHLKSCLLHLSIFPEKYVIEKESVVRRWIAEGFIPAEHGYTPYESGERCFHELINRCLIQPVKKNAFGEVKTCQVHDIILDFIVYKSVEENFITVYGAPNITHGQHKKVRRLSLKDINKEDGDLSSGLILSHARSVTMFGNFVEFPPLLEFRMLRVLDIQDCDLSVEPPHHLENIGLLFRLKYLNLKSTKIQELPQNIKGLQSLETLNVRGNLITELPASIIQIGQLVSLFIDQNVKLPDRIGEMLALQELELISASKQTNNFWLELEKLTNLRKLSLSLESGGEVGDARRCKDYEGFMVSSICKLGKHSLRSLSISVGKDYDYGFLQGSWNPLPSNLSKLVIKKEPIARVPNWVGSSLVNLQQLYLSLKEIQQEDVSILGTIPFLLQLVLYVQAGYEQQQQPKKKRKDNKRKKDDKDEDEEENDDVVKEKGVENKGSDEKVVDNRENEEDKKKMIMIMNQEVEEMKIMTKEHEKIKQKNKTEEDNREKVVANENDENQDKKKITVKERKENNEEKKMENNKIENMKEQEVEEATGYSIGPSRRQKKQELEASTERPRSRQIEKEGAVESGSSNRPRRRKQTRPYHGVAAASESSSRPIRRRTGQDHEMGAVTRTSNRHKLDIKASHGFPLLRYLKIDGTDPRMLGLKFGAGSMPKLEELVLMFKASEEFDMTSKDSFFGINYLSHLVHLNCVIDCFPRPESIVAVMEAIIRKAVSTHPNQPRITICKRSLNNPVTVEFALLLLALGFLPFMVLMAMPIIVGAAAALVMCSIQ